MTRLPVAKTCLISTQDHKDKRTLWQMLRYLHNEASKFIKEQGGYSRIRFELKIVVR